MKLIKIIKKNNIQIIITLCMFFVIFTSIFMFMGKSLRLDEAQSLFQTNGTIVGTVELIAEDIHLPIYFIILHIWKIIFDESIIAIRSLSLLFLLISIPAIYFLGKEVHSKKVGVIASVFCAISPFLNWFASETRMYTLLFLITTLNQLFFIRIWNNKRDIQYNYNWLLYMITTWIGVYTHFFFSFILFVQAIFYFTHIKFFPKKSFIKLSLTAIVSLFMLGVWFYLRSVVGSSNSAPLLIPPSSVDVFNVFSNIFIGFQPVTLNTFFLSLWPVIILISFTMLTKHRDMKAVTKYLLMSVIIPITLVFIVSSTIRSLFLSRYLIIITPSVIILFISFFTLYSKKTFKYFITILFVLTFGFLMFQFYSPDVPVNEDYRNATDYIEKKILPSDLFVVSAPFITYPVEYYYNGKARLTTFPVWNRYEENKKIPEFSEENMIQSFTDWSNRYTNFYILMSYDQGYEEKIRLYLDSNFERVEIKEFSPKLKLYIYKVKYI